MSRKVSPFLDSGSHAKADSLAIIFISRDDIQPLYLRDTQGQVDDGYVEGAVFNTRFGSYPHSTLMNVPWGSQVRASKVDTGSRGRKRKRQHDQAAEGSEQFERDVTPKDEAPRELQTASAGFIHILLPTPELWTLSLPHRTQVVYTPDYSYILQRIRARPGTRLIEAGAGSGSFTHAAVRAVYNGYPKGIMDDQPRGKVLSFEYDETRYHKMAADIKAHGLEGLVHLTHRDVYQDGFQVEGESLGAEAVFLDLPAPWRALPHLSRRRVGNAGAVSSDNCEVPGGREWVSPLNPKKTVYICTFSPCIEQVTKTVSTMRRLGWLDIETVEIANKRIHAYRDKPALLEVQPPSSVMEAVKRLKAIENKSRVHSNSLQAERVSTAMDVDSEPADERGAVANGDHPPPPPPAKPWLGRELLTRTEPDVKTHTSYLTFAILPREWSDEDEAAALERWPCNNETRVIGSLSRAARKEEKRQQIMQKKKAKGGMRSDRQ